VSNVLGTFSTGNITVTTVQFDYEAIKENYSRLRTEYISATTFRSRTTLVSESSSQLRTVYIESQRERTAYAA
jgi:hypothetical protein